MDRSEVALPGDDEVAGMLEFCGVEERDAQELIAARPDGEWWAVLETLVEDMDRGWDRALPPTGYTAWQTVPTDASAQGLFVGAWALLARLPELIELHARRGVPESVTKATVSALGGVLGSHRQVIGRGGVGLFPLWGPPLRFRGTDFQIGRHDFTRAGLGLGDEVSGHVLMVHVPPIGPLDANESEDSIRAAEQYFAEWYPEEPVTAFTCTSWLLDPQLGEYLHPDSNILQFQRRFTVLPELAKADASEADREMMRLGLHVEPPETSVGPEDLARIPQETTLQKAFVSHIQSGRHWAKRTGVRPLKGACR